MDQLPESPICDAGHHAMNSRKGFCAALLVLVLNASCSSSADEFDTALHEADVLAWRESRRASLMAPTGFLNLAGLYWLEKERSTFGSSPDNDLVFPAVADPVIGEFRLTDDGVMMLPRAGVAVSSEGEPVAETLIADDTTDSPVMITHESLAWTVIKRDGRYAVRLRDFQHPALASFPEAGCGEHGDRGSRMEPGVARRGCVRKGRGDLQARGLLIR